MKERGELGSMLRLAAPLVLSELGWMTMGIVDTMFVGRVSAEAIGAVSLGTTVYHTTAGIGAGLLLGLDTLVSQSFGAGDRADVRRSLVSGVWLAMLLTPLVMGIVWAITPALRMVGLNPDVLRQTTPYIGVLNWSTLFLMLFFALRRYLQAIGLARPVMIILFAANLLNVAGNWIFVFGNLGAPKLGAVGSGWSTFVARAFMLAAVGFVVWKHDRSLPRFQRRLDGDRLRRLLKLGVPAAGQMAMEYLVWTTATLLAGRLPAHVLAAHQIALMTVSTTFMMPLGVSSAAAVRVGHSIGRGDLKGAAAAGWTALGLGSVIMSMAALVLLTGAGPIARLFTPEAAIIAAAAPILRTAAFFQLFDGFQVVATGALRGAGDTRTPMLCHFAGYWLAGFPLGAWLAFGRSMGALGLWIGLSLGVILIGSVLLAFWWRTAQRLEPMLQ